MRTDFTPRVGLPVARSRVEVREVVRGQKIESFDLVQLGGPVPQDDGGALAALESDPLVLAGDEVYLFLVKADDVYRSAAGGVFLVENGRIRTPTTTQSSPVADAVDGLTEVEFSGLVRRGP